MTVYIAIKEVPMNCSVVVSVNRTVEGAKASVDKDSEQLGGHWRDDRLKRFDSTSDYYWICESELEE